MQMLLRRGGEGAGLPAGYTAGRVVPRRITRNLAILGLQRTINTRILETITRNTGGRITGKRTIPGELEINLAIGESFPRPIYSFRRVGKMYNAV